MSIEILEGQSVQELLSVEEYRAQWHALVERCPWSTPFQTLEVIEASIRANEGVRTPIIVFELDSDATLRGVLPLLHDPATETLVMAGAGHAHHHGWLAEPLYGSYFFERAVLEVMSRHMGNRLVLADLLPDVPRDAFRGRRRMGGMTRTEAGSRWLLEPDRGRATRPLDKKLASAQYAALKAHGDLALNVVPGPRRRAVLERATAWHGRRMWSQGVPNRFDDDPTAKSFLEALCEGSSIFTVTELCAGAEQVSFALSFETASEAYVDLIAEHPNHESASPALAHLFLLEERYVARGIQYVSIGRLDGLLRLLGRELRDLTTVELLFRRRERYSHGARKALLGLGRTLLNRL